MDTKRSYRIGQAAHMLGVTTRTLRHYDHLGLVTPSARTTGRARRYTTADMHRLRTVIALATLDVPLREIGPLLDLLDTPSTRRTSHARQQLVAHREDIQQRAEMFHRRAATVDKLLDRLADLA